MHRRNPNTSTASKSSPVAENPSTTAENRRRKIGRPPILFFSLIFLLIYGSWGVFHYQFEVLPAPLSPKQAGKRGFSEELAMQHVIALTKIGPHPVGSEALELAFQYVLEASKRIKESAHWEVNVEVDLFHAKTGVNRLIGGIFKGKTHVYSDLKHVVLRISPKYLPEAEERAVLVSSHIDTVFSTQGAGDCSSCVAVMLELARGMSQWAHGFQNSIIFLFNTGEEEGLIGAHSFITQHPWRSTIRFFVDLEAMGIGGKSSIFQTGGDSWAIEAYSRVSKYPSGMITAQDLFRSGAIKSATDFQVYAEVAGLPGLDFAYVDSSAVYHTKNDKLELLKPGSLQHLGGDMLSFLLEVSKSSNLSTGKEHEIGQPIFFDVMGMFMVLYSKHFSNLLNNSVIAQSLIIWTASILLGGYAGVGALGLSFLSIILTWVFSVAFSLLVAVLLPLIGPSPTPYVASPWLLLGLFAAPALLGALTGQSLGFIFLQKYLHHVSPERGPNISALQAERWVFKTGFIQWLCALILGNYFNLGSSFVALVWLVLPALAYGLIEATLTPARSPKPLRVVTLVLGSIVPLLVSAGMIIRLVGTMVGIMVRFERNPGAMPEWLGSAALAVLISALTCLVFVFFLSYLHLSGAKKAVVVMLLALLALTLTAVATGIFPPYTEDFARAVNVVHVVESTGDINRVNPTSYTLLFSTTPGKLEREMDSMKGEHFSCGRNRTVDLVTFSVDYGCLSLTDSQEGWAHTDIPLIRVEKDIVVNGVRSTRVSVDTKSSTRWSLSINFNEIEDFTFRDLTWSTGELVSRDKKTSVNGQHVIQFAGGKQSPTKFELELFWYDNKNGSAKEGVADLLKLRTDLNMVTPKVGRILDKLPSWCSLFGKSTFPYTLAFLTSLPVDFKV